MEMLTLAAFTGSLATLYLLWTFVKKFRRKCRELCSVERAFVWTTFVMLLIVAYTAGAIQ